MEGRKLTAGEKIMANFKAKAGSWHKKRAGQQLNRYESEERDKEIMRAVGYMKEHGVGAKMAVKRRGLAAMGLTHSHVSCCRGRLLASGTSPSSAAEPMSPLLAKTAARNQGNRLLTDGEESQLVTWLVQNNKEMNGKDRPDFEAEILDVLRGRRLALRQQKFRIGEQLSQKAKDALSDQKVSRSFFTGFEAQYADELKKKRKSNVDASRAHKATKANADKVFKSLYKELLYLPDEDGKSLVGTPNPYNEGRPIRPIIDEQGRFTEPVKDAQGRPVKGTSHGRNRLLQIDEVGQMMSFDGQHAGKTYAGAGDTCAGLESENRTSFSVMPCSDASAHLYKFQMNFAKKTWTCDLGTQTDDGQNYARREHGQKSMMMNGCILSLTENGVQTDVSLSQYSCDLISDLLARVIEFPVVIMTDGHSSRMGERTTAVLRSQQLRIWLDMSKISGWRQMWDQLFKGFHAEYVRIFRSLAQSSRSMKMKMPINNQLVLQIMDLMYGQHGFRWCTVGMLLRAFTITGVGYHGLDFDMIPERVFIGDRIHAVEGDTALRAKMFEGNLTEEDLTPVANSLARKGSTEYYKSLYESAVEIIGVLQVTPVLPKEMGLCDLDGRYQPEQAGQKKRFTQVWGSLTLCNLNGLRRQAYLDGLAKRVARHWKKWAKQQPKARLAADKKGAAELQLSAERGVREFLIGLDYLPESFEKKISGKAVDDFLRINRVALKELDEQAWKERGSKLPEKITYLDDQIIVGEKTDIDWARSLVAITDNDDTPLPGSIPPARLEDRRPATSAPPAKHPRLGSADGAHSRLGALTRRSSRQ